MKVNFNSSTPIYLQIVEQVEKDIKNGKFIIGDELPSINLLKNEANIARETVKQAYQVLKEKGLIYSKQGKGFYVKSTTFTDKITVLLVLDDLSAYKLVLYRSLLHEIGDTANIHLILHNKNLPYFRNIIDENLGNFNYYLICPHFALDKGVQNELKSTLRRVPPEKLILLDKDVPNLPGGYGAVYQDFQNDIYSGLLQGIQHLKKYKKINLILSTASFYANFIKSGFVRFCKTHHCDYEVFKEINSKNIKRNEAFIIANRNLDQEIIDTIKISRKLGLEIGKDIGIISYNEAPINEVISNGLTVISTDFKKMGKTAAEMIKNNNLRKIHNDFLFIARNTL